MPFGFVKYSNTNALNGQESFYINHSVRTAILLTVWILIKCTIVITAIFTLRYLEYIYTKYMLNFDQ